MKGPYDLSQENIDTLSSSPGVYILGHTVANKNYGVYVGRSDNDLKGRLQQHLPANETDTCIKRKGCDRFWYEYSASAKAAYEKECQIYHRHNHGYVCNDRHPAKSRDDWRCPVCGQ